MSGTAGTSTLPSFVAEIDRLSDELELFGFPRMLPPEFMPNVYSNGKMEMESVKVLDLLHTLMDALWTMIQAKHRDREQQGDESDVTVNLRCELKTMEIDFQKLQIKVKKKNHELCVQSKETVALKSCQKELMVKIDSQAEMIRMLKSQLKHLQRSMTAKLVMKDCEITQLKEKLQQSLGLGISHGSQRPTESEALKAANEQERLLKDVIMKYQETNDALLEENLALFHKKSEKALKKFGGYDHRMPEFERVPVESELVPPEAERVPPDPGSSDGTEEMKM